MHCRQAISPRRLPTMASHCRAIRILSNIDRWPRSKTDMFTGVISPSQKYGAECRLVFIASFKRMADGPMATMNIDATAYTGGDECFVHQISEMVITTSGVPTMMRRRCNGAISTPQRCPRRAAMTFRLIPAQRRVYCAHSSDMRRIATKK